VLTPLPLSIVLAEDNPPDVTLVDLALRRAGLRILSDGEQARAFIESLDRDARGGASADSLELGVVG